MWGKKFEAGTHARLDGLLALTACSGASFHCKSQMDIKIEEEAL
jgi:hypothetical protein